MQNWCQKSCQEQVDWELRIQVYKREILDNDQKQQKILSADIENELRMLCQPEIFPLLMVHAQTWEKYRLAVAS